LKLSWISRVSASTCALPPVPSLSKLTSSARAWYLRPAGRC
jgi:hypothetical protein